MRTLKNRRDFLRLKQSGHRLRVNHWMLLNLDKNSEGEFRCGWTLTRKVGSAVTRNKLKRWCREFFRQKLKSVDAPSYDVNVIFCNVGYEFYKNLTYSEFDRIAEAGWKKIERFRS